MTAITKPGDSNAKKDEECAKLDLANLEVDYDFQWYDVIKRVDLSKSTIRAKQVPALLSITEYAASQMPPDRTLTVVLDASLEPRVTALRNANIKNVDYSFVFRTRGGARSRRRAKMSRKRIRRTYRRTR
jgi:hypothetical protein